MNRFKLVVTDNGALMQHDSNGDYVKMADVILFAAALSAALEILDVLPLSVPQIQKRHTIRGTLIEFETGKKTPGSDGVGAYYLSKRFSAATDNPVPFPPLQPYTPSTEAGRKLAADIQAERRPSQAVKTVDPVFHVRTCLKNFNTIRKIGPSSMIDCRRDELIVEIAEALTAYFKDPLAG